MRDFIKHAINQVSRPVDSRSPEILKMHLVSLTAPIRINQILIAPPVTVINPHKTAD